MNEETNESSAKAQEVASEMPPVNVLDEVCNMSIREYLTYCVNLVENLELEKLSAEYQQIPSRYSAAQMRIAGETNLGKQEQIKQLSNRAKNLLKAQGII